MSRRARRKRGVSKGPWFGKFLIGLGIVLIFGVGIGYAAVRMYLHSDSFRKFMSAEVSHSAKVDGMFAPFFWDGLAVETGSFEAKGEGLVSSLKADRINTEIGFGGLTKGVWELREARIAKVEIELNAEKSDEPPPSEPGHRKKAVMKEQPGWVPDEVVLESVDIGEVSLKAEMRTGMATARGMSVHAVPSKGKNSYEAEISGGSVSMPIKWVPELRIDRIRGTYRDGSAFVTRANAGAWSDGIVTGSGEWNFEDDHYAFEGNVDGVKCAEILNENWAQRLTGDASSTYTIDNRGGTMVLSGEVTVRNGTMTALPMLDALAAYADTRRFRILQLNEAHTKWRYSKGEILLTDFVMGSEGLIRLVGNLSIKGKAIDGRFRLGLVPGTLKNIPGAETDVFKPGSHGLLWTDLHVTGTLEDPEEDLTDRLVDAAGMRMFENLPETGDQVLKFSKSVLGEAPDRAIEESRKLLERSDDVIREADDVIRGAGGVIKGLLGN